MAPKKTNTAGHGVRFFRPGNHISSWTYLDYYDLSMVPVALSSICIQASPDLAAAVNDLISMESNRKITCVPT